MRGAAPSRRTSATTAPAACRASRPHAAAAGPSQPRPRRTFRSLRTRSWGPPGVVGRPLYDGAVPLSLIVGPANAGKVELLLDRYLAALDREPILIVPNRSDVEQVERQLLARRPALLAGTIG